jgi:hypothetical protein
VVLIDLIRPMTDIKIYSTLLKREEQVSMIAGMEVESRTKK